MCISFIRVFFKFSFIFFFIFKTFFFEVLKDAGKRFLRASFKKDKKKKKIPNLSIFISSRKKRNWLFLGCFLKKDFFGNDRAADNKL